MKSLNDSAEMVKVCFNGFASTASRSDSFFQRSMRLVGSLARFLARFAAMQTASNRNSGKRGGPLRDLCGGTMCPCGFHDVPHQANDVIWLCMCWACPTTCSSRQTRTSLFYKERLAFSHHPLLPGNRSNRL